MWYPLLATSEWRWILMFAHGFNGRETESWINYKRSMESTGKTQEGSTWFWNRKRPQKRKLSDSWKHFCGQSRWPSCGLHSTHWCWNSQLEQFWPPETFSSVCRHFSLSYWWGRVLLASSGYRPRMLLNILQCTGQCPEQGLLSHSCQ